MTWRQWLVSELMTRGLWSNEAEAVVTAFVARGAAGESMADRLDDALDGYPVQTQAICLRGCKAQAVEWIDANKPRHFARPMFLPAEERKKLLGS